jgi:two-component system sensor kinase FixL
MGPTSKILSSRLAAPVAIAVAYYLGARLGFALTLSPVPVSILWPPNAILLAGLLLTPVASWRWTLLTVFGAHLGVQFQSGVPAVMVLCWYVSNCAEALMGAALLRRLGHGSATFETFRGTALFLLSAGIAAPFLTSFLDAGFVEANGWGNSSYWTVWRTRFFSNVLATITLVPTIVTSANLWERLREVRRGRLVEAILGFAALSAVCWIVFVRQQPGPGASPALLYTPVPLLVGAAVRFGPRGASASILTCALVAIYGAALGQGPFVTSSAMQNALSIQLFLIVAWIPVMSLSAVLRERAHAEEKARRSEEELAIALEAAQLGRWEWDLETGQIIWSDTSRRILEIAPDRLATKEVFDAIVHPDDRSLIAAASAECFKGGPNVDLEYRIVCPDGRVKWVFSKGKIVHDDEGRPTRMVGVNVDITERKLAEMEIRSRQRELAERSDVSLAGELSIALAHEVNQPLAAILANAGAARRFLLHDPPDLRELGEIVAAIADDNRRAAAVITRFGALITKGQGHLELLQINDVIAGVVDVARGDILSRGVSVTTSLGKDLPAVLGDTVQIQQVVLNLIVNACDALESAAPDGRRLVVATAAADQGGVRISVSDTGPGVPADRGEQIFEPFVTSKPRRLGLGLAICRSIVSAHDGSLWVESQPDRGATFFFSLPAHYY